jgi:hypothetical protein
MNGVGARRLFVTVASVMGASFCNHGDGVGASS